MIIPIDGRFRPEINRHIAREWCGPLVVTRGVLHDTSRGEGFAAVEGEELLGYILYAIENLQCEILVLHSLKENQGVGRALIQQVIQVARENQCRRVWLITTNDNMHGIRYYQRVGLDLAAVHINAIERSRELKPSIPLLGNEDIPIKHEFEFEYML